MRIGFGTDIHKLVEHRKLILGGVNIPFLKGELAHSDGDVVYHAIGDAILGALALGDLGKFFPDADPKLENCDSSVILSEICRMMTSKGFKINNLDVTISLEKPKISTYIEKMRINIAQLLLTDIDNVSVKAGTNEGLDSIGNGEAVKAECIVSLRKDDSNGCC